MTPSRRFTLASVGADLLAAVTLAAVLAPTSVAYAHAAGLPAEVGLSSVIGALLVYGVVGRISAMALAPVPSLALITGFAVGRGGGLGLDGVEVATSLALLCACGYALVFLMHLDRLAARVSPSAATGFISGCGVLMIAAELGPFIGLPSDGPELVWTELGKLFAARGELNSTALLVSVIALTGLIAIPRVLSMAVAVPSVMVAGIAAESLFGLGARGVHLIGEIPSSLPLPAIPRITGGLILNIGPLAAGMVLVGLVKMVVVGRSEAREDEKFEPRRETMALALSSLGASALGGMGIGPSMGRARLVRKAGARTPLIQPFAAILLVIGLLLGADMLGRLPVPVLAALIMLLGFGLLNIGEHIRLWKSSRRDACLALIALAATTLMIEAGIATVIAMSIRESLRNR